MYFLYFLMAIGALWFLIWLYDNWDQTPEGQYGRLIREFERDADRRGLTFQQKQDELSFRRAMVSLREKANNYAIQHNGVIGDSIAEIAEREARLLAHGDKAVARNFLRVVMNSPVSEILYDDGCKALITNAERHHRRHKITNLDLAALRTK